MPWLALGAGVNNGLYHWAGKRDFQQFFNASWSVLASWSALVTLVALMFAGTSLTGILFAVGAGLTLLATFHEDTLVASGQTLRGALFAAFFEITRTVLVLILALETGKLLWVIGAYVAGLFLKVAFGVYFGHRLKLQKLIVPQLKTHDYFSSVLRYAVPVSFSTLIAVFTHYADQLILSKLATATYFAGYTLGCLTVPPLNSFEQAVNRVLIPSLEESEPGRFREAFAELAWILIPATTGLFIFADPIVRLLFTERYADVSIFLKLYAFNYLLYAFPYDAWARARGDSGWIFKNLVVAFAIAVVLIPFLAWRFLGVGALAGLLITQLSLRIGGWLHIRKTTNWSIKDFVPGSEIAYNTAISLILAAASLAARPWLSGLSWLFVCMPTFAILYLSLTIRKRFLMLIKSRERPGVLMMTQFLEMGGLERVIYSLCTSFRESGAVDPFVLSYDRRENGESLAGEFEQAGVGVIALDKGRGFSLRTVIRVIRTCVREKIGILHTHDLGPLLYAACAKTATLGALKIVHTQHSFVHLSKKRRHRAYERIFTRFADELVTVSLDSKSTYAALGVNPDRIQVVPNGALFTDASTVSESQRVRLRETLVDEILSQEQSENLKKADKQFWLLYLARIHPQKGQNWAIEAWKQLPDSVRSRAALIFVGQESFPGEISRLQEQARAISSNSTVIFAGMTRRPLDWLRASDALCSLSDFEGMPLSPIEALGSGLPVVLSRIAGHEIFREASDSDILWVDAPVTASSGAALGDFIRKISEETPENKKVRFERAASWRGRFGTDKMSARYQELYLRNLAK